MICPKCRRQLPSEDITIGEREIGYHTYIGYYICEDCLRGSAKRTRPVEDTEGGPSTPISFKSASDCQTRQLNLF